MIGWLNLLRKVFGASFLWLICLIYFTQVCLLIHALILHFDHVNSLILMQLVPWFS